MKIKATNKKYSHATLISMVNFVSSITFAPSFEQQKFNPEGLAAAYHQGCCDGRWYSLRSAVAELGNERSIAIACDFANLPALVKGLFLDQDLTYGVCAAVITLEKLYGRIALVERAKHIPCRSSMQVSVDEIICYLAGTTQQSATVIPRLRIPAGQRKLILEFHCQDSRFTIDRSNQLIKLVEKGMASLIESALATLGAKPKI